MQPWRYVPSKRGNVGRTRGAIFRRVKRRGRACTRLKKREREREKRNLAVAESCTDVRRALLSTCCHLIVNEWARIVGEISLKNTRRPYVPCLCLCLLYQKYNRESLWARLFFELIGCLSAGSTRRRSGEPLNRLQKLKNNEDEEVCGFGPSSFVAGAQVDISGFSRFRSLG